MSTPDLDNIKDFAITHPGGWRLLGSAAEFDDFPETHKEQIMYLDETATKFLFRFIENAGLLTGGGWDPFARGNFAQVEEYKDFYQSEESQQDLKKWLYRRAIPFRNWVFVLTGGGEALMMTWKMVLKYSHLIFPFDDTMVFDKTLNWCLFYYHEDLMFFGRNNVYDTSADEQEMQRLNERKKKYPAFRHPYL